MPADVAQAVDIDPGLIDALAALPVSRTVSHCGAVFEVSPFDLYAACPACGARVKVRGFSAGPELEDVFDAVFAWTEHQPQAAQAAQRRRQELLAELMADPAERPEADDDRRAARMSGSATFYPFVYLHMAADTAFQAAKTSRLASDHHRITAVALAAFAIEAHLNHVGEAKLPYWKIVEPKLGWRQKLELIACHFQFKPDFGRRPYQTVGEVFALRDKLAHGKTWVGGTVEYTNGGPNGSRPNMDPDWMSKWWSDDAVRRALEDMLAVIEDVQTRSGLTDSIWLMGEGSYEEVRSVAERAA